MANISIFGGTGYLGYHLTAALAKEGHSITIFSRKPIIQNDLQAFANVAFVKLPDDDAKLKAQLIDTNIIINLIGTLDTNKKRLNKAHIEWPKKIFEMAHSVGVKHFIHMSALGTSETSKSRYFKTKFEAESALLARAKELPVRLSVLKPSLIFGKSDPFFSKFIRLINMLPYMMIPRPNAEFQPIYIGDLVNAINTIINTQEKSIDSYELVGPTKYSLLELIRTGLNFANVNPKKAGKMPDFIASITARSIGWIPKAPFNYDQYLSLQVSNSSDKNDLARLGITATPLESILAFEYSAGVYDQYYTDRILARR